MVYWVFVLIGFAFGMFFGACLVYGGLQMVARIMAQVQDAIDNAGKVTGL